MNNVEIKINGYLDKKTIIMINEKLVKPKKNKFGGLSVNYSTESETCNLKIFNYFENSGKLWYLIYAVYFLISVFGLFDLPLRKKRLNVVLSTNLNLSEHCTFNVKLNAPKNNEEYATIESENTFEIIDNRAFINTTIKKRIKIYRLFKLFFWLALIIAGILLIFLI